jgi:ParB family chromosome partitioning protein
MVSTQRGLGRGLDALFKSGKEQEESAGAQALPLSALSANPQQPRRHFAEQPLEELAESIKNQGLLQPILVRPIAGSAPPRYEIVAGERRWRAAQRAGLSEVPVVVRELTDQETLILALVENLQREDLNPMEEARGFARLKEEFGLSQEDLAQRVNKSRSAIANSMRLLSLPDPARDDLASGRFSAGHARALLTINAAEAQEVLRQRIVREHLSVRETEALAAAWKENGALPAGNIGPAKPDGARRGRSREGAESGPGGKLDSLREELARGLALPVTVAGNENKGTISVRFNSADELRRLLVLFGLEAKP